MIHPGMLEQPGASINAPHPAVFAARAARRTRRSRRPASTCSCSAARRRRPCCPPTTHQALRVALGGRVATGRVHRRGPAGVSRGVVAAGRAHRRAELVPRRARRTADGGRHGAEPRRSRRAAGDRGPDAGDLGRAGPGADHRQPGRAGEVRSAISPITRIPDGTHWVVHEQPELITRESGLPGKELSMASAHADPGRGLPGQTDAAARRLRGRRGRRRRCARPPRWAMPRACARSPAPSRLSLAGAQPRRLAGAAPGRAFRPRRRGRRAPGRAVPTCARCSDNHEANTALHAALAGRADLRIVSRLLAARGRRQRPGRRRLHAAAHRRLSRRRRARSTRCWPTAPRPRRAPTTARRRSRSPRNRATRTSRAGSGESCHEEGRAGRRRGLEVRRPQGDYRDLIWEAGKACFDSVPGREAEGPRRARGRLRHARAHRVPEPHLVAGRRGARHPAEHAQRAHRAHVRLRHRRHPLRLRVHRRRPRRPRDGARRGEAQPAERRRGDPQHGHRRGPRVGGGVRAHRAALLRAGRPAPHGRVRHHRGAAGAGGREEPHARRPRTPTPTSTRAPRSIRCSARG